MFRAQTSIWAKFLKGKYCRDQHPSLVTNRLEDSRTWKSMLKKRTKAEQLFIWEIGEGRKNVWLDNWTGEGLISPPTDSHFNSTTQKSDLWSANGWNQQALQNILDNRLINTIMKKPFDRYRKDKLIVKKKVSQTFLAFIANLCFPESEISWTKCVWNKYLSPSMAFLSWKLLYGFIPTDDILKLKGLRGPSRCCLCKCEEESLPHLFFKCYQA
ncbi:uncharacterized protein LOC110033495 [Phalaenopsis equestris]|uniref:uncharacterized protein LOC110033495 n=1 Tax=Phalaenopsis equestris TaxID=78828 RepID=UPI0009E38FBE|nr:uncharacterized protein LOC110033495 [Phalaenopsis equestris]